MLIPPGTYFSSIVAQGSEALLTSGRVGVTSTDPCNESTQLCDVSKLDLGGTPGALSVSIWNATSFGVPTEPIYRYFIFWLTSQSGGTLSFSTVPVISISIIDTVAYTAWINARPWAGTGGTGNYDGVNDSSSTNQTLSLGASPSGAGTISCSSDSSNICQSSYSQNTQVTLLATPQTGYQFQSWTGTNCVGTTVGNSITVTLSQTVICTANFTLTTIAQKTLTVQKSGTGTGTVQSIFPDSRISCGTSTSLCTASFDINTSITLNATAATNSVFAGWENCTDGKVVLSENKTCIARFTSSTLPSLTLTPLKLDSIYQFSKTGEKYPLSNISIPQDVQMGFSGLLGSSTASIKSINTLVTTQNGNKTLSAKAGDFIFLDALVVPTTTFPIDNIFVFMGLMGENSTNLLDTNTVWLQKANEYSLVTDSTGTTTQETSVWQPWTNPPTIDDLKFDALPALQTLAQDNGVRVHVGSGQLSSFRLPSGFVVKDLYFFVAYKTNGTYILGEPLVVEMAESEQFVDKTTLQMSPSNVLTISVKEGSSVKIKSCTLNNPTNTLVTLDGCTITIGKNAVVGSSFVVEVDGDGGQFNTISVTIK
ncbi:InlB B-repeat-containing protein [Beggiatoa leptomitoformis]|uniref:Bacterial repeat domain-containing protein n=1 Tax=Beggiatoa leptomitoformis TaxID=288004 RepID=A0A2N9YGL4_9GAMM|nr:hypothetical protein [Beggiatoa leptomitoformis]ALG68172.2 hypothetical protein AL038_11225 [Beggiatoa leptomitoformis]AUI69525.2 hypothetical protein BLE401_13045 [Beggiatoa leptomitoformis]